MTRHFLTLFTLLFFLVGCSSSIRTVTDSNPAIDFSTYQTFSWISDQPFMGGDPGISPLTRQRVQDSIQTQLMAMNFQFVSDPMAADFVVSFSIGSRQGIRVDTMPSTWSGSWSQRSGHWGCSHFSGCGQTNVRVRDYTEGQLAIDIFDVKTSQPAWHGFASRNITSRDQRDPMPLIQEAVAKILEQFPVPAR